MDGELEIRDVAMHGHGSSSSSREIVVKCSSIELLSFHSCSSHRPGAITLKPSRNAQLRENACCVPRLGLLCETATRDDAIVLG